MIVSILQNVIRKILRRRPCQNFLPGVLCVTQGHRITYRYVTQGRLWVESSSIDSGPVPFAVTLYGNIAFLNFLSINQSINKISIAPHTKCGRRRLTM